MFPIGAVFILVRVIANAASGSSTPARAPATSRGSYSFLSDSGAFVTLVLQVFLWAAFTTSTTALLAQSWGAVLIAVPSFVALFPWYTTRRILVPLGLAKTAYQVCRLSRVTWREDKPGGPALAAAWALARSKNPSAADIAWVEAKLDQGSPALQASGIVAMGLLAAAKGELTEARRLLESIGAFDERIATRPIRRIASSWLLGDAAAEGRWEQVLQITLSKRTPWSRTMWLLDAIARRELGKPMSTLGLWVFWLMAPRRLRTFRFVALVARRPEMQQHAHALGSIRVFPGAPLEAALYRHCSALTQPPRPAELVNVALAWERALDDRSVHHRLEARAAVIGASNAASAIDEVRALVEAELAPMVTGDLAQLGKSALPRLVSQAFDARRDELHRELEDRASRLDARREAGREVPSTEEWRELQITIAIYRDLCALGGIGERSLAFSVIRDRLVNYGAWLFNARTEKPVANAVFRFLHSEAVVLGDEESAALNRKNIDCGL